jgi:hypothetical protein
MAVLSTSRMALMALAVIIPLTAFVGRLSRPVAWALAAPAALLAGWVAPHGWPSGMAVPPASRAPAPTSPVRDLLGRIAVQRWRTRHGGLAMASLSAGPTRGIYAHRQPPQLVWPVVCSITGDGDAGGAHVRHAGALHPPALDDRAGRLALAMILTYWFYSFGENLEVLTYIAWPALLAIGIVLRSGAQGRGEGGAGGIGLRLIFGRMSLWRAKVLHPLQSHACIGAASAAWRPPRSGFIARGAASLRQI